jgi:two-component system sensor histidine kinase UhpB
MTDCTTDLSVASFFGAEYNLRGSIDMDATTMTNSSAAVALGTTASNRRHWGELVARRILGVPIFTKVLVANSAIVVLGAVFGTWLTVQYRQFEPDRSSGELVVVFALVGLSLCLLVNVVVLKAAFRPLASLERAIEEVRRGNYTARAAHVAIGDPEVDQVIDTLNAMLDGLERYREQVGWLSRQVLTAQEEERQRIARELHDETAQSLTSLLIGLRMIEKATTPQDISARVAELRAQTGRTLEEVRKMAVDLRPSTLDDLGLAAALQWYTHDFARRTRTQVRLTANGLNRRLSDDVEVVVYRIVQEALTNVAKHADARSVDVSVTCAQSYLEAAITDDGRGFDVDAIMSSRERGLGLFGMQERVALVGGTLQMSSQPGRGCRVSMSIPLESDKLGGLR